MYPWLTEIVAAILLGALPLLFTYKPTKADNYLSFADLKHKYQKWEWFGLIPLIIFLPLMIWAIGQLLQYLMQWEADDNPRIKYQLFIDHDLWYIPALFMAVSLIYFPIRIVYSIILTSVEYTEYTLFTNLKHGYDGMKVFRQMAWVAGVIALVMIFFMSDYYIKIWNYKIEVNKFKGTGVKEYNFKQVKKITYVEYTRSGEEGNVLTQDPPLSYFIYRW
ncbi:hypothetical protein [uncultured Mucilaginibacter sp.]|uniref:hypothetical protein n=1 Tax=uncultured Mucilaginibacter sp. TaxID=797541 RepID=UPI0025E770A9|nr:hypothetical protein [uncultured Mucilaginibacter sp.]